MHDLTRIWILTCLFSLGLASPFCVHENNNYLTDCMDQRWKSKASEIESEYIVCLFFST